MTAEIHNLPSKAPAQSLSALRPDSLRPTEPAKAAALISPNLALVRPVSMTDEQAEEWLMVAAKEIAHIPADILADACAKARRKNTHHGQIVPTLIAESEERIAYRRTIHAPRIPPERRIEEQRWKPDKNELAEIHAQVAESLKAK